MRKNIAEEEKFYFRDENVKIAFKRCVMNGIEVS